MKSRLIEYQAAFSLSLCLIFCACNCHNLPAQAFYRAMGGVVGAVHGGHADRAEDQMYFEFQTVKKPAQPKVSEGRKV